MAGWNERKRKSKMYLCSCCKGAGKQVLHVETYRGNGSVEYDKVRVPCIWCDGSGEMTLEEITEHKQIQNFAKRDPMQWAD